eukprot:16439246-Heterocapsa_arctica.AAC.1
MQFLNSKRKIQDYYPDGTNYDQHRDLPDRLHHVRRRGQQDGHKGPGTKCPGLGGQVVECEAQGRRHGVHHGDGLHLPELWILQQSAGGSHGA